MTTPFVATLRARRGVLRLGAPDARAVSLRVEVPEVWDVVRIETPLSEPVLALKYAALAELQPQADPERYVIKLHGFEVLDETMTLEQAGAIDGSIFLVTNRRRRPVR